MAGKRESCNAARIADRATTSASGPGFSTCPTQPRSAPPQYKLTKAPLGSQSAAGKGGKSGMHFSRMALEIALRAISTSASQSSLDSRDILSVFAPFENSQVTPLLHAAVDTAPKLLEILKRGDHCPSPDQPQQQHAERPNDGVLCRQDHRANGDHLQNHFCLPER